MRQKRSSNASYKGRDGILAPNWTIGDDIFFPKPSRITLQEYLDFPPSSCHPFRLFNVIFYKGKKSLYVILMKRSGLF